jgi:hypothetical protein
MPGPQAPDFPGFEPGNRAPHFVGQPLRAEIGQLGPAWTVELWFYNCMPADARPVTGCLFALGQSASAAAPGERLEIGGQDAQPGKLVAHTGGEPRASLAGATDVPLRNWVPRESWRHVALVRDGEQVRVYLDGRLEPEVSGASAPPSAADQIWIGGRSDGQFGFEGRIDEVAFYGRALAADEVKRHYEAATGR